jgi:hypothetical protein
MSVPEPPEPPLTPAEARLLGLLVYLQAEALRPGEPLETAIMRTLRWQVIVRGALREVAGVIDGIADTLARLLGLRRGGGTGGGER